MTHIHRAAIHESGHATSALSFSLPLRCVFIRDDGTGGTSYARKLGPAEASSWTTTAYAGPAAELLEVQRAAKEKPVPVEAQGATLLPASVTAAPKAEPEEPAATKKSEELNVDAVFAKLKQLSGKGE